MIWSAMTVLMLRDYLSKKSKSEKSGPLTQEERAEKEKILAELPRWEWRPMGYLKHPKELAKFGAMWLGMLPFILLLLPVIVLGMLLPDPNRK